MTKEELVAQISEEAGVSKNAVNQVLNSFTSIVVDRASNGYETKLHGFGTFLRKDRAARTGRNPATGKPIRIDAVSVLSFKPSKTVKDQLN